MDPAVPVVPVVPEDLAVCLEALVDPVALVECPEDLVV